MVYLRLLAIAALFSGVSPAPKVPVPSASLNASSTIFVILMENRNWSSIQGSASAPYINNTLLPMASYATQYYTPPGLHPSLPNYLWLEAGTNFNVTDDSDPSVRHQPTTNHFVTLLNNAAISWTSYQEDIAGTVCPLTAVNKYAPKHNPMVYFDDVTNTNNANSAYCIANVRPYSELATDLANHTVTRYNFITPNLCDDMHDSTGCATTNSILNGDNWLAANVPTILSSQAYNNGGALFIVWDEGGSGSDGPIGMIVLSPRAKGGGYHNTIHYNHSSTLRTFQKIFGVGPFLGGAANTIDLSDLFVLNAIPNADSQIPIKTVTRAGTTATVTWQSQSGLAYQVQWKNNLTDVTWLSITPTITGTGGVLSFTDDGTQTGSPPSVWRYYRVIIP